MDRCPVVSDSLKAAVKAACPTLVLASQSPNRRALLESCSVRVVVRPQDINEICGLTDPAAVVQTLSRQKMDSYLGSPLFESSLPAIAVDTLVCLDGRLLGKPSDRTAAEQMLEKLSGRTHEVLSGMSLYNPASKNVTVVCTIAYTFNPLWCISKIGNKREGTIDAQFPVTTQIVCHFNDIGR